MGFQSGVRCDIIVITDVVSGKFVVMRITYESEDEGVGF